MAVLPVQQLIDENGGPANLAHQLRRKTGNPVYTPVNIRNWRCRNRIPPAHWVEISSVYSSLPVKIIAEAHFKPRKEK